jgi:hypothetical protein
MEGAVATDHDLLHLGEQSAVDEELEILAGHPGQEALQPRRSGYASLSGMGTTGRS